MAEYLVWIAGDEANALFFARGPAADLAALRRQVDPVIESVKIP